MDLKKMHTDLENILYTEEEKMYIDNDENKTLMIENLQKEIVIFFILFNFSNFFD